MKKRTFLVLGILLLLVLSTSCSMLQTGGLHIASKFTNRVIYFTSDGIHTVNFKGKDNELVVSTTDILKLYNKKKRFDKITLSNAIVSKNRSKLFFVIFFKEIPQEQGSKIIHNGLFSVDSDGRNLKQLTQNIDCYEEHLSPNKNLLAFIGVSAQKKAIYLVHMNDGKATRITPWYYDTNSLNGVKFQGITDLTFSKDSRKLFFVAKSENTNNYDLNMLNVNNGSLKKIVSGRINIIIHGWSPDGKKLAFTVAVPGYRGVYPKEKLYVVDSNGSNTKEITKGFYLISSVKWSNDSLRILFHHIGKPVLKEPAFPENNFLSVTKIDGKSFKEIGGYDTVDGYWVPGEKRIVAVIGHGINFALEKTTGKQAIYVMDADSMNPTRVTPYYTSIGGLTFCSYNKDNKIIFKTGVFPYLNVLRILNLSTRNVQTIKSFSNDWDATDIIFSTDYKKYFVRVIKTSFDTTHSLKQIASIYIYNANTDTLISKFESNDKYLGKIKWIDNKRIGFVKEIISHGTIERNTGILCILNVYSGKIIELTRPDIDLSSSICWLAVGGN